MQTTLKVLMAVLCLGAGAMLYTVAAPYNDTDNVAEEERSGLYVYTDHGTGCQYLKAGFSSSLVPRMDGKGHVGCRLAGEISWKPEDEFVYPILNGRRLSGPLPITWSGKVVF